MATRQAAFANVQQYYEAVTERDGARRVITHWYVAHCLQCEQWWANVRARAAANKHHKRTGHSVVAERHTIIRWSLPAAQRRG